MRRDFPDPQGGTASSQSTGVQRNDGEDVDRFMGFYWTLPVPWAGFTRLPGAVDEAAAISRTIRYQRDRVRRWVQEAGGSLIHEEVFLELAPDRGSQEMVPALNRLLARCEREDARLVLVRFRESLSWRAHQFMENWIEHHLDRLEPLDPVPLGGEEPFDPVRHFKAWRDRQDAWTGGKEARRTQALYALAELAGPGRTHADLAQALNERGLVTPTGKTWTAESVRKLQGKNVEPQDAEPG